MRSSVWACALMLIAAIGLCLLCASGGDWLNYGLNLFNIALWTFNINLYNERKRNDRF